MRRLVGAVGLLVAASVALSGGGPDALVPFKQAAGAASEVSVAFVIDFAGLAPTQVGCVTVPGTDNGYQALAAFTEQEHDAPPTYNGSGLLCSIDGIPNSGCGVGVSGGYIYWSYWHGDSGGWAYASTGASQTVHSCNEGGQDCDVEGWRFENPGKGNQTDPAPAALPDYSAICSGDSVTLTDPGDQTSTVGSAVSLQAMATDSANLGLTFSAVALPAGLSISSSGLISGIPTTAGTSSVTLTAKDSRGASQSADFTWTVLPIEITIATTSLPIGSPGTTYSATLRAVGGHPPYSWSVISGRLPRGLKLTKKFGTLIGIPKRSAVTTPQTTTIEVEAEDARTPGYLTRNEATKTLTITIS